MYSRTLLIVIVEFEPFEQSVGLFFSVKLAAPVQSFFLSFFFQCGIKNINSELVTLKRSLFFIAELPSSEFTFFTPH